MNSEQKHKQQLRLKHLSNEEREEAFDALTEALTQPKLLGGHLEKGPHNTVRLVNGRTRFGAHSEYRLGTSNVLYHYEAEFLIALYDCEWEWPEDRSLAEQFVLMAYSRIPKASEKYKKRKEREADKGISSDPVSFDVEWIGKEDDYSGEESEMMIPAASYKNPETGDPLLDNDASDSEAVGSADDSTDIPSEAESNAIQSTEYDNSMDLLHKNWELVCAATDDDPEMARYVQVVGECKRPKEVREKLGLKEDEMDSLRKKVIRRVKKMN